MSKSDLIYLEGVVTSLRGAGTMVIECDKGIIVNGVLSGKLKKNKIKVMIGDRVQVGVSPYDPTHGLITFRFPSRSEETA